MKPIKVLLVDDNERFLESAARFLRAEPSIALVALASSGPEAIAKVPVVRPDVVIMDVTMPEMSGLEAARHIKARAAAPKVLMISMHDDPEHRLAAVDAGVDGYVGKWEFAANVMAALRAAVRPEASRCRVLIVDDEPAVLSSLVDLLASEGHEVEGVSNGRLALSRLTEGAFDVILSDVRMPDLDGRVLHRELMRQNPDLVRRLVFMTGDVMTPETTEFLAQTDRPTLTKPFTLDDLRQAFAKVTCPSPRGNHQ